MVQMKNLLNTLIGFALIVTLPGCHLMKKEDDIERDWLGREVEIEYVLPSKVVAIWSNSVFNEVGDAPMRGLGGRVYFYDDEHHAVRVNGKLSVYLYDDTNAEPGAKLKQEASRVVHFTPDEVQESFSPSEFGASYSFWVPWDRVGGDRKQLSVIPVFTDESGQMLVGEQARQLLPGAEPVKDGDGNPVVPASYTETSTKSAGDFLADKNIEPRRFKSSKVIGNSSTIKLPASMQQRLRRSPPKRQSWNLRERSTMRQVKTAAAQESASASAIPTTTSKEAEANSSQALALASANKLVKEVAEEEAAEQVAPKQFAQTQFAQRFLQKKLASEQAQGKQAATKPFSFLRGHKDGDVPTTFRKQ